MESIKDKVAIVTGATSGMGKDIAEALINIGAKVILGGRDNDRGNKLVTQLGSRAFFQDGDVKEPKVNERLVKTALTRFGHLDLLVMAAGQLGIGRIDTLSLKDWDETIATNLSAVFYLLKVAIPAMKLNGGGSVVIIGSVAAHHAFPNHPAYTASKGALPALVKQVARDYSPAIRINLVSPAQVETPLLHHSVKAFENPDKILEETAQQLPMKRLGQPQDITSTVIHLLSANASWITGSNFIVDGGFLAT